MRWKTSIAAVAGVVTGFILCVLAGLAICEYAEDFRVEASGTESDVTPNDFIDD